MRLILRIHKKRPKVIATLEVLDQHFELVKNAMYALVEDNEEEFSFQLEDRHWDLKGYWEG